MLLTCHTQFTAKQLNRQAAKAGKDEITEKNKLKKVRCPHYPALPFLPPLPQLPILVPNLNLGSLSHVQPD